MTQKELSDKITELKEVLLDIDVEVEKARIQRANIEKAIEYLELDLFEQSVFGNIVSGFFGSKSIYNIITFFL